MVRYIEIPKPVHCPKWGIDICLENIIYPMIWIQVRENSSRLPVRLLRTASFPCISMRQSINCSDALNICNVRC